MSTIAISGATGLIGGALGASLREDGHTVKRITRQASAAGPNDVVWDLDDRRIDAEGLDGVDAVVHLAGEPIGDSRWTAAQRRRIHESRTVGTRLIAETLAGLSQPPPVLVTASGVGYYGSRGDEILTESSSQGDDFMAHVCADWEAAAAPAAEAGIRVAHSRTGVVMAPGGPLIDKVELPFRLGVGGRIGDGRQFIPWIALADVVRALRFLIDRDELAGPVNVCTPEPVTNLELTKALGEVLRRPTVLPVPKVALQLLYGDVAVTLAYASQRAVPERLLDAGFEFTITDLRAALAIAFDRVA